MRYVSVELVVKVERIPDSGMDLAGHLDPSELQESLNADGDTGLTTPEGGDLALHLERIDDTVRIGGHVEALAIGTCGRCLGPARLELAADLNVTLLPAAALRAEDDGAPAAADDQEADLDAHGAMSGTYHEGKIELAPILREALLLELPIQFLCRENCAGLCDQCGKNLNLGPCGCVREQIDPRWEGLKSIKVS